ncbi:hypothetical protein KBW71_00505 [Hydrogenophaga aromaticivorans]|uniref:hypothetical protein n=1 Tax=Hydrogenophaga aromaticivorans TaxID=2610898 RepID=UPI001B36A8B7|nr:hypothetical protein [Hydrogenophaga aromaticivorans]MBQ0916931.1 hypothetical protein [Hydrogenophaga aromaticivorans]
MRKSYLSATKSALLSLLLLTGSSVIAQQAFECQPGCGRICDAARAGANRQIVRMEEAAVNAAEDTARNLACTQRVLDMINQVIPYFGGGTLSTVAKNIGQNLANEACQLIKREVEEINQELPPAVQSIGSSMQNSSNTYGRSAQSSEGTQSVFQRFTNLF